MHMPSRRLPTSASVLAKRGLAGAFPFSVSFSLTIPFIISLASLLLFVVPLCTFHG